MSIDLSKEKVPPLKCIFFAEFDKDIGRKITLQIPEEVISADRFSEWNAFVLPKKEMLDKLVKVNLADFKIMGYPIGIEDPKYPRNAYYFNLCFVTENISHVDCLYEPVVQKFARYLCGLEKDYGFLNNESTRATLPEIFRRVFEGLNQCGRCSLVINDETTIDLKLNPHSRNPPHRIPHHYVPVYSRGPPTGHDLSILGTRPFQKELKPQLLVTPNYHLTLIKSNFLVLFIDVLSRRVAPWIDGKRSVRQIGLQGRIDPVLVAKCVENLIYYDFLVLVPPFEYRNIYIGTPKLHEFYKATEGHEACLRAVGLDEKDAGFPEPNFHILFRLLTSLQRGLSVKDWALRYNPREHGIHERKLIQYGLMKGIIRKLSGYPVFTGRENEMSKSELEILCNGRNAIEDLASTLGTYPQELEKEIADNERISVIWK